MDISEKRDHAPAFSGSLNDACVFQGYVESQRSYFSAGATSSLSSRIGCLKRLKQAIQCYEKEIVAALYTDFKKCQFEAIITETAFVINEIDYILKHLSKWYKPTKRRVPFLFFPGTSFTVYQPYGVVLVIAPWNYPFQLSLLPVVGAIAAGNCVTLKPSELTPATSSIIAKMISEYFDPSLLRVVEGGVDTTQAVLRQKFDYIFYTGNPVVARKVMEQAARHLTPVTLELGGKNPCIVTKHVNLKVAARRIVSGKLMNCGQTCVAPDYLLVDKSIKEALVRQMVETIHQFYGKNPETHPDYARIINKRHFERLLKIIENSTLIYGGHIEAESCYIQPTLIEARLDSPAMQEEIFGPLLPVIEIENLQQAVEVVNQYNSPLVAYLFSTRNDDLQMLREKNSIWCCGG